MLPLIALLLAPELVDINALVALPGGDVVMATRSQLIRTHPPPTLPHVQWTVELADVTTLARAPGGERLFVGTSTGEVLRVDARSGRTLGPCGRRLRGSVASIAVDAADAVAVSTMGDLVRCSTVDGHDAPLRLGGLPPGVGDVPGPSGVAPAGPTLFRTLSHVAFGPGERMVIVGAGAYDGGAVLGAVFSDWRGAAKVRLIEPQPRAEWHPLRPTARPHDPWGWLRTATFSPTGDQLALGYTGGAVEVVDLDAPAPFPARQVWSDGAVHTSVHRICWAGDALHVAHWQGVRRMHARTGAWRADLNRPTLRAAACGAPIVFADRAGLHTTGAWEAVTHAARAAPAEPVTYRATRWPSAMKFPPQVGDVWLRPSVRAPRIMFLDDRHVLLYDGERLAKLDLDGRQIWSVHGTGAATYSAVRLDATRIAIGDARGAIAVFRLRDGRRLADLPGRLTGWVHALAVSPDGTELVAGTLKGDLGRWRLPAGTPIEPAARPAAPIAAPLKKGAFDPPTPITYITDLQFAPDGALLITGRGGALLFEDWPALHNPTPLPTGPFVYTARFSPDARHIAIGEWQGRLLLLTRDGRQIASHAGPPNWVNAVRWKPDGSGIWAQRPRSLVWMTARGAVTTLRAGDAPAILSGLDLSPDGAHLALVPDQGGVVISPAVVEPGAPITVPPPLQRAVAP